MAPNQYGTDHTSRKRTRDDSVGSDKRIRTNLSESDIATSRPDLPVFNHPLHEDPQDVKGGTEAKHESGWPSVPPNTSAQIQPDDTGENHSAAALDAELRATQLELKVAQLQAKKRAALSKQMKPK
jgi:hypothetical protein